MSGRKGQVKRTPMADGKGRSCMWQAMRVLRQFSAADIVATADVTVTAAAKYVRFLHRGGYLRCVRERQSGRTGGHALYRLVRDTGPYAPRIGKRGVQDPNITAAPSQPMVSIPRSEYERALRCIHLCESIRSSGPGATVRKCAAEALEVAR